MARGLKTFVCRCYMANRAICRLDPPSDPVLRRDVVLERNAGLYGSDARAKCLDKLLVRPLVCLGLFMLRSICTWFILSIVSHRLSRLATAYIILLPDKLMKM